MNNSYEKLLATVKALRNPDGGCPWDLKQNLKTLGPSLLEECCECLDGISNNDNKNIKEEIGDIIFTATVMGYILEQDGVTTVAEILGDVNNKMISRHPHVFSNNRNNVSTSEEVLIQWEDIKEKKEGRIKKGILDNIPKSLPPLEKSNEIQKKVEKVGFDWPNINDIFDKIVEETNEVKEEITNNHYDNLELEIGDLLFSVINLSRYLKVDPSIALSRTNNKFVQRFKYVEKHMKLKNLILSHENFKIMDNLWDEAKKTNL
ncbi:MAG: nucleoside triphosphate pyrophosphohydrolase [Spirochaetaceae bacterium]